MKGTLRRFIEWRPLRGPLGSHQDSDSCRNLETSASLTVFFATGDSDSNEADVAIARFDNSDKNLERTINISRNFCESRYMKERCCTFH